MSAILEEGIGFGGNATQQTDIPQAVASQYKSNGLTSVDLTNIIKEVGGKITLQDGGQKPLPPSDPNSGEANFPSNSKDPFRIKDPPIGKVIDVCNQSTETPSKKKSIAESKKLIESFKEKLSTYPKYLSYEGSVVLCVLISIHDTNGISLSGLPLIDRHTILQALPPDAETKMSKGDAQLSVEFDSARDFILTYTGQMTATKVSFFNTVIHPQKLPDTNVPIEQDGNKVTVGTNLVLDQQRIQKLVGNTPLDRTKTDEEETPRRQAVAGRNAYEIRADVLQMAIEWTENRDEFRKKDENDVINLARKFYEFVEDRRRR